MHSRRTHNSIMPLAEINMTPLMDLTFLLLIVFMITAPVLQYGLDVSPPKMDANELPEESLTITINKNGHILYGKQRTDIDALTLELQSIAASRPDVQVLVRADGDRAYREVINVMKNVRAAGIEQVMLVTEAENIR